MDGSSAPMNLAQTVQLVQHMQNDIRDVQATLLEVQRDVQHSQEHILNLREKSAQSYDEVHALQVGHADTNINLDKVSKELSRVGQSTQKLQLNDLSTQEKITVLEESTKITDTRFDKISKEVAATMDSARKLQDNIERSVNEDLRKLRKEIANTNLTVNQTVTDQKAAMEFSRENRDAVRDSRLDIEKVLNEVKKANTVTNILENRMASTAKGLQQSWGKCAEMSDTMVKLTECYDKTKARVADAEGVMKEISNNCRENRTDVDQAMRCVEQNSDRLSQALKRLDEEVAATEDMRHQINGIRQGQANSGRQVSQMKSELADVKQMTSAMTAALKETTTMTLPNIHNASTDTVESNRSMRQSSMNDSKNSSGSPGARPMSQRGQGQTPRNRDQRAWA